MRNAFRKPLRALKQDGVAPEPSDWSDFPTTKMAHGKVENKRLNDKFYFVVDELGGSPDIESELASDNDSKSPGTGAEGKIQIENPGNGNTQESSNGDANENSDGEIVDSTPASPDEQQPNLISSREVDMDIDADSPDSPDASEKLTPVIKLTFRDEEAEKMYRDTFLKFLSENMQSCTFVPNNLEIEIYEDISRVARDDVLDFELDTTPRIYSRQVEIMCKTHDVILSDQILDKGLSRNAFASACFNCLENHNLRDCPKPKDFRAINRNRLKFQQNSKAVKTSRYHLDENQKFSHIVPGVISRKLRSALNLKRDQQPEFIYRMRKLGYPPAWLEEAKVSHSGVAMYNDKNVPVLEDGDEEGEIIPDGSKDKYDITKIIEFPGFNVPLPKDTKDETKYYKCPLLKEEQSKERMISELEPNAVKAYKKRSLKPTTEDQPSEKDPSTPSSPSIEEMEEQKKKLLIALDDDPDTKLSQDDASSSQEAQSEAAGSSQEAETFATPAKQVGNVKHLDYGTPVLKSVSPFAKLPSREQFSVNVSDVINFENLPNSTGKYETMTHLISKIRDTKAKIEKE